MAESNFENINKLFLYCPETVHPETLKIFVTRGYETRELGEGSGVFWSEIENVAQQGTLVLYSHGDAEGPLLIKGSSGDSMGNEEIDNLANTLSQKEIKFYLLSCETGAGSFFERLTQTQGVHCAAPRGYAEVGAAAGICRILSIDGTGKPVGWVGSGDLAQVAEQRSSKPLQID